MKVLMFGWEFPPHISGGLGTASFGLTKAMHQLGTDIIFVVPKLYGDEDSSMFTLQDADSVEYRHYDKEVQKLMEKIQYLEIESSLVPYLDPEQYERFLHDYEERTVKNEKYKGTSLSDAQLILIKAVLEKGFLPKGTTNITKEVLNWAENKSNLKTVLDKYYYVGGGDSMGHHM